MHRSLTAILACLGMVGALAIDTYLPSMPAIGLAFGVGPALVQQTLSIYLFTFALMMLFYGTLSDSFGRRPVILVSLVLYTVASVGAACAPSFGFLLGCRALQGLAAGAGSVVGQAIVQDRFSGAQAQRMLSHIMLVFGLAPAIAPVLGGYLQVAFGWRASFVFLGAFGVAMFILCWRALPESLPRAARHPFHPVTIARNYLLVLRNPQFLLLALSVGMAFGGLSLYIGSAAQFVMGILHQRETAFGWLFIPLIGGMVIGSVLGGKLASAWTQGAVLALGFGAMATAAAINVVLNGVMVAAVPWAVLPLALFTFGLALAMPPLQVRALALFPGNRGLAASLQSFMQMMAFALVSGLIAPLLFDDAFKLACGLATLLALSIVSWRLAALAVPAPPVANL